MKIAVVIPAYNEQDSIRYVVDTINKTGREAGMHMVPVVIDDSSTDNTLSALQGAACVILPLPVNLGIGGAVQTGFQYAAEHDFTHAVQVDGDGQHPPEAIPAMARKMEEMAWDVIIGSRFIDNDGFQSSFIRRLGIKWFSFLNRILTGYTIKDSTSGFRMINRKTMLILAENYPDDYPEPEAVTIYAQNKLKVGEIAVQMKARRGGTSSIDSFQAFYYMWKVTLGILISKLKVK